MCVNIFRMGMLCLSILLKGNKKYATYIVMESVLQLKKRHEKVMAWICMRFRRGTFRPEAEFMNLQFR